MPVSMGKALNRLARMFAAKEVNLFQLLLLRLIVGILFCLRWIEGS